MEANKTVLILKYVKIIEALAVHENISLEEAMDLFYKSQTSRVIAEGVGDLHCLSVDYLADEIVIEFRTREKMKQDQINRLCAYTNALKELRESKI